MLGVPLFRAFWIRWRWWSVESRNGQRKTIEDERSSAKRGNSAEAKCIQKYQPKGRGWKNKTRPNKIDCWFRSCTLRLLEHISASWLRWNKHRCHVSLPHHKCCVFSHDVCSMRNLFVQVNTFPCHHPLSDVIGYPFRLISAKMDRFCR